MTLTVQDVGMLTYKREHDKFQEQFRTGSSKYVFDNETEFKHFIAGMKRWVFLDTVHLVFANFKGKEWARSSLQQLIKKVYLLQEKFSEDEQDSLGDMLSELKNVNSMMQKQAESRTIRDEKIKSNLL